jgi:hypothetical protein
MLRDGQGRTALHRCALAGHAVVATMLVDCIAMHWRAGVDCINVVQGCKPQFCSTEQRAQMEAQGAWPWLWAPAFVDGAGRLPLDYVSAVQDKWMVRQLHACCAPFSLMHAPRLRRRGLLFWVRICARERRWQASGGTDAESSSSPLPLRISIVSNRATKK